MIVIVALKTRAIISVRVEDPAVAKEVRKLATWGGGVLAQFPNHQHGIWQQSDLY